MPLPAANTPWPPPQLGDADQLARHNAWWVGDPALLESAHASQGAQTPQNSFGLPNERGTVAGAIGSVMRNFWRPRTGQSRNLTRLHVPLPAGIASISAGLLFAEPPTFVAPEGSSTTVTARVDELINTPWMHRQLTCAAEQAAALRGVFGRVVVDDAVAEHALLDWVAPDHAWGEFRWGRLLSATFVTILDGGDDRDVVWRHLERHEMQAGVSVIRHGLYLGSSDSLGDRLPIDAHEATAWLASEQGAGRMIEDTIVTASPVLTACYVPNLEPSRRHRSDPHLADVGRSDFAGIEGCFDTVDELWSSLRRDFRLGAARAMVPESMLRDQGNGKGVTFDEDQEYWRALRSAPSADDPSVSNSIVLSQPDIRVEQHLAGIRAATETAVRGAGYSPMTFGLPDEVAATATEIAARERATVRTRGVKARIWGSEMGRILRALLAVDHERFASNAMVDADLKVEWPPPAADPMTVRATTVEMLLRAQSASTRQRITILHPDWDDGQLDTEVALIQEETGQSIADPAPSEQDFGGSADDEGPDDEGPEDEGLMG